MVSARDDDDYLREAIALARANIDRGGRPFGAVLVRDGLVLATGVNEIHATHDPTAHAELLAVRQASRQLASPDLSGSIMYASGQPCPMCLAAMRLAGVARVRFAYSNAEGEAFGLSSAALAEDLARPLSDQAMDIAHSPVRAASVPDLYATWQESQSDPDSVR